MSDPESVAVQDNKPSTQTTIDRWVIELVVSDKTEALRAYDAIEKLLVEMGEIGSLCFWRRTHNRANGGRACRTIAPLPQTTDR